PDVELHSVAVELRFVHPARALRRLVDELAELRRYEAGHFSRFRLLAGFSGRCHAMPIRPEPALPDNPARMLQRQSAKAAGRRTAKARIRCLQPGPGPRLKE